MKTAPIQSFSLIEKHGHVSTSYESIKCTNGTLIKRPFVEKSTCVARVPVPGSMFRLTATDTINGVTDLAMKLLVKGSDEMLWSRVPPPAPSEFPPPAGLQIEDLNRLRRLG